MNVQRAAAALARLALFAQLVLVNVGCTDSRRGVASGGASIAVLFDERHDLEGGELVRLHDFDIGVVEAVDLLGSRVRATIRLAPDALDNLTVATTFRVETKGGERYLETYVLDADAERLDAGATLAGADGNIELIAMRASAAAGSFVEATRSSEWWEQATDLASEMSEMKDEMKRELDATDWTEEETELREHWERAVEQMDQALRQGEDELRNNIDALVEQLEQAGNSDKAQKLKERFEHFVDELR